MLFGADVPVEVTNTWFEFRGIAFDKTALLLMVANLIQLVIIIWLIFRKKESGEGSPS